MLYFRNLNNKYIVVSLIPIKDKIPIIGMVI